MTRKPRILVVDDDEPILILMKNILREFQFEPLTASSGSAALTAAADAPPDLILLDRNMPEMSGEEFIARLRTAPGAENIPVLILSGDPLSDFELAGIGAVGAIQKPFDLGMLVANIRQHLPQAAANITA